MSGDSRDYYRTSSSSSGGSRRTHRTYDERDLDSGRDDRHLPSIRDVVGEQLNTPVPHHPAYNLSVMDRALPEVCQERNNYPSQPGPVLPPIVRYESSSQRRHGGHESTRHDTGDSHYHRNPAIAPSSSSRHHAGRQSTSQGSYHVFAQSETRGELIPVSTSSMPQGIMRDRAVSSGQQPSIDDTKKRFECHVCGRRMERQSVYNQHMITHTDERPHICTICGKSFNSKSNLNRHVQTHGSKGSHHEDSEDGGAPSSSKSYYSSSRRK